MIKTIISKTDYKPIQRFGSKGYIIHYNPQEQDNDNILCCENIVTVSINTKENLYQAIINYKYSISQIATILTNNINNANRPEYLEYIAWKEYAEKCASIIFDAPTLENTIKTKLEEITKYDVSSAVNGFYYQGSEYWLDKDTRVGLMNSTTILKEAGETTANLWFGSVYVTLTVDDVISKLSQLEMYALECYNVTAQHKAAIMALQTIEAVEAYDYTVDYPAKLDLS